MNLTDLHWLAALCGVDMAGWPADAELQFTWQRMPRSWGLFVAIGLLAALVYGLVWLYRRDAHRLRPAVRAALILFRLGVAALLVIIYLGPSLTHTEHRVVPGVIVLLRDSSRSMSSLDRYPVDADAGRVATALGISISQLREHPLPRAAIATHLLQQQDHRLLGEMLERGELRIVDFAEHSQTVETRPARLRGVLPAEAEPLAKPAPSAAIGPLPRWTATGTSTNLAGAIHEALAERSTAAMVLFTDGQQTAAENPTQAARQAGEQQTPLLIVGIGDPQPPRNIQVTSLQADPQVWQRDPFLIQALLHVEGAPAETLRMELTAQLLPSMGEPAQEPQVLETRHVPAPADGGPLRLEFTHTPELPGRYAYSLRVEPLSGEVTTDDNRPPAPLEVNVLSEQARVLLVAGAPTWEYQLLQRLLSREPSIDLSCWQQTLDAERPQDGNTPIERLPVEREELFAYDAILLLDPDPRELDEAWIALLRSFVEEHGGGLLYMAGPKHAGRLFDLPQTRGLRDLLPVQLGDTGATQVAALLAAGSQPLRVEPIPANVDQPMMRFFPEVQRNLALWESLPNLYWSFPSESARPAARVLLAHSDPRSADGSRPLLVAGPLGAGHTVYAGFNGTWRWRPAGYQAEFYDRFWIQTVRHLVAGRAQAGRRRGTLETDRLRYEVGDRIALTAWLRDSGYLPLELPAVTARLQVDANPATLVTLRPVPNQRGQYTATLTAAQAGRHQFDLPESDDPDAPTAAPVSVAVTLPRLETSRVWLDQPRLQDLARLSGGRYFQVDELDQLPAAIPDRTRPIRLTSPPRPLWDNGRMLLLLVALLGCEWSLRRWFRLL